MSSPVSVPTGVDRISPWIISRDTAAEIEFLHAVFGAVEKPGSRVMNGENIAHVEVELAGMGLLMFDATAGWRATPSHLRLYVADLAGTLAEAAAQGAVVITETTPMPFGDLAARFRDPQGHRWWVHQHVEDVPLDEMTRRFGDPATARAMAYFSETLNAEMIETH